MSHERYMTLHLDEAKPGSLAIYRDYGGYEGLAKALKKMTPQEVIEEVKISGLRGRGGAGFNTGLKWSFMPEEDGGPRYLAVNADESEPGTFKDRLLMEKAPHMLLEGMAIACYAIRAQMAYLYIRGEYAFIVRTLERAIREARKAGYLGEGVLGTDFSWDVDIYVGAGAYICGEETGMLESLEGKKGLPRKKPPFPAQYGLWGRPTTVNNVETLANVSHIIRRGADWYRTMGTEKSPGNLLFGVSGHVNRPGVYELPLGTPLREVVYEHAGGMVEGKELKAVIPGGASCPLLPAEAIDVRMDYESLREARSLLGTGAVIVMDETTCITRVTSRTAYFFRHESCGQCTQCREGTAWAHMLLKRLETGEGRMEDVDLLEEICENMEAQTICALADADAWAISGAIRHFREEMEVHVVEGGCPFGPPPGAFPVGDGRRSGQAVQEGA